MKQSILAIDDELHMLKLLERIINEKTDYPITTINNSLEVPDFLKENKVDLIITDLKMPGMDGLDILKYIKENERSEEVVIMTAFGSLDTALDALNQGVFDYITKPFKKEQIIMTIDRAMRWHKVKVESERMSAIFDTEPYSAALEAFKKEYVYRLKDRYSNESDMIAKSGLTDEDLKTGN